MSKFTHGLLQALTFVAGAGALVGYVPEPYSHYVAAVAILAANILAIANHGSASTAVPPLLQGVKGDSK